MVDALNSESTDDQVVDLDETVAAVEGEGGGEGEASPEVVETVITEAGAQPEKVATQGGVNRLLRKLGKANSAKRDVESELQLAQQRAQMLELKIQQLEEKGPPDPSQYDEGIADPKYVAEQTSYIAEQAAKAVRKDLPVSAPVDTGLERAQMAHAERAENLGIANYADVQDAAIDALGGETVNAIIQKSPKSEVVLYFLGANPGKAEDFRHLVETDPTGAAVELGRMEARLSVERKSTTQPIPDPDTEIRGGTPTAGQANSFQKRLDKAREAAGETPGLFGEILKIKREAAAAGVEVT